jgi:hypothetical protein
MLFPFLMYDQTQALRTIDGPSRPGFIYISVGHRVSLATAVAVVRECCKPNNRLPVPIHEASTKAKERLDIIDPPRPKGKGNFGSRAGRRQGRIGRSFRADHQAQVVEERRAEQNANEGELNNRANNTLGGGFKGQRCVLSHLCVIVPYFVIADRVVNARADLRVKATSKTPRVKVLDAEPLSRTASPNKAKVGKDNNVRANK